MRISEYLMISEKMKSARIQANISQRKMATALGLGFSTYSNYENAYSEPTMEIIQSFCNELNISVSDLLEVKVNESKITSVKTFAELFAILIDLDKRGLPIERSVTFSQEDNELIGHLKLDFHNPQLATLIPDWNKVNKDFESGLMDDDDYKIWLEDVLSMFNIPIDSYIGSKK